MDNLKELLSEARLEETSVPAVEINTYLRLWNKVTFLAREKEGKRVPQFQPYRSSEFLQLQMNIARGLLELGVEKGDFVAIFSPNSLRYAASIYAILSIGAVFIPLYPTMTEEIVDELLRHSNTRILIAGDVPQYQKAVSMFNRVKSPLRKIIVTCPIEKIDRNALSFDALLRTGAESKKDEALVKALKELKEDDLAALIYTPGTTGVPKGALLSHGNFLSQRLAGDLFEITEKDVRLAYLPFSHVFGLSADLFATAAKGNLVALSGILETEEILNDISEIEPTVICSVPRMYEKMYITIVHVINRLSFVKRFIFNLALKTGRECFIRESRGDAVPMTYKITRSLLFPVYKKMKKSMHMSRIKILFSGGGPLPIEVAHFFGGMGLPILEGYGLTETSPIINVNTPRKNRPGTVGPPVPRVEEKISDEGEILVKGPQVFKGYYLNPAEEKEAFAPDGFFRTGDLGRFDEEGHLIITGRLKDIIITSGGKNIVPLSIEKRFESEPMIESVCVVGDRRKYVSALVVPNFTMLRKYAKDHHLKYDNEEDLIKSPGILNLYRQKIEEVSQTLARYEQIKKFTLLPHPFAVDTGELSSSYKFRRHFIHEKFKDVIDRMYPASDGMIDNNTKHP